MGFIWSKFLFSPPKSGVSSLFSGTCYNLAKSILTPSKQVTAFFLYPELKLEAKVFCCLYILFERQETNFLKFIKKCSHRNLRKVEKAVSTDSHNMFMKSSTHRQFFGKDYLISKLPPSPNSNNIYPYKHSCVNTHK